MASLRQGWKTLASTEAGLCLQHMTFCLDLALRLGARPLMLVKENGSYIGCALSTPTGVLQKNNQRIVAGSAELMPKSLGTLSQHETGILELIKALNDVPPERRDWLKNVTITRYHLETPRQIHNLVRRFRLTNAEQSYMLASLKKLSFTNEYWSLRDLSNIERVAQAIAKERYLDDTVPMPYDTSYIFTNDICMSSLGAFGKQAPAPYNMNHGEVIIIPHIAKGKSFFELAKRPDGKTVRALGLFVLSLTEAANSWREMKTKGTMKIDQKKGEILGAFWNFPKDSPSGAQLSQILMTHFGKTPKERKAEKESTLKRKRKDEEKEVKVQKKARGHRGEMFDLLAGLGLDHPDQGGASDEEFEEADPEDPAAMAED
nr:MAG: hypothetical protein [Armillaria species ambi-like virus 7]